MSSVLNILAATTTIDPKLIDQLFEQTAPEDLLGENGLIKPFAKAILERALQAEMTTHLGHEPGVSVSNEAGNKRNRTTSKTVQGELGKPKTQCEPRRVPPVTTLKVPRAVSCEYDARWDRP